MSDFVQQENSQNRLGMAETKTVMGEHVKDDSTIEIRIKRKLDTVMDHAAWKDEDDDSITVEDVDYVIQLLLDLREESVKRKQSDETLPPQIESKNVAEELKTPESDQSGTRVEKDDLLETAIETPNDSNKEVIQNPIKELRKNLHTVVDATLKDEDYNRITVKDVDNVIQVLLGLWEESVKPGEQMAETKTVVETVTSETQTLTESKLKQINGESVVVKSSQTSVETGTGEAFKKDDNDDIAKKMTTALKEILKLEPNVDQTSGIKDNAATQNQTSSVKGPMEQKGTVTLEASMKDGDADKERESELKQNDEKLKTPGSAQRFDFDKAVQRMEDENQRRPLLVDMWPKTWDDLYGSNEMRRLVESLLIKLPYSTASEDKIVMTKLQLLTSNSPSALGVFGDIKIEWPITKLLNPTSIKSSYSDASLQSDLVSIVLLIAQLDDNARSKSVDAAMPFLIECLKSKIEIRRNAAAAISALATLDSNRKKVGESGVIKQLVKLVQEEEGDMETVRHASRAIRFLWGQEDVSDGAVIGVIDKIKSGIHVEEMVETLEVLLGEDESVIAELEDKGMLQCLFTILKDDATLTEKGKEYCMLIIHAMCVHGDVTKINELEKGRQTLDCVAITGTRKAREKATDLVWMLDLNDIICKLQAAK